MTTATFKETIKTESENYMRKLKALIREGNVRRVIVEHEGKTVAEFPLTAGVIGAVAAPVVAAIGALVAVLQDCTIHVEKTADTEASATAPKAAAR